MEPVPTHCPRCASTRAKPVIETNYGWYWRCEDCAEVWHQDTRPRPTELPPFFERYSWALIEVVDELLTVVPAALHFTAAWKRTA